VPARLARTLLFTLCLVAPFLVGCSLRRAAGPPPSPYCRSGDPLAGVYRPQRLEVKSRCRVVSGTVEEVKFERYDGDIHIDLLLDETDQELLSRGNDQVGGALVVEIIPQDRGVVAVPQPGERITVVGPFVEDMTHGWREIHPAWWVSSGRIVPATPQELQRVRELLLRGGADDDGG
jgi:hypothetical protein